MLLATAYHLVLLDASTYSVLLDQSRSTWVLPSIVHTSRQPLSQIVTEWLETSQVTADVIHEATLGRYSRDVTYGYCALIVRALNAACPLRWVRIDVALQPATLTSLEWLTLATCMSRIRSPTADFDSPRWLELLNQWAATKLIAHGFAPFATPRVFRYLRNRRIIEWPTARGVCYLKAGVEFVPHESRVTRALAEKFPQNFPTTIAVNESRGWWLCTALPGTVLTSEHLTSDVGSRLGRTVARLQRDATGFTSLRSVFGTRHISHDTLTSAVRLIESAIPQVDATPPSRLAFGDDHLSISDVVSLCHDLKRLPCSFLHCDLWLGNIIDTGSSIGLIDLENAQWGPVTLSLWPFIRRVRTRMVNDISQDVIEPYIDEWSSTVSTSHLRRVISMLHVTGRLFHFLACINEACPWILADGFSPHRQQLHQALRSIRLALHHSGIRIRSTSLTFPEPS